jgi:hypothetical protein
MLPLAYLLLVLHIQIILLLLRCFLFGTNDPTASGTLVKTVSTPNLIYSAFTTFTSSMPEGGTVANINDFDPATVGVTTTVGGIGTNGTGANPDYVVALYNVLGTANKGRFIDVKDIKLSFLGY